MRSPSRAIGALFALAILGVLLLPLLTLVAAGEDRSTATSTAAQTNSPRWPNSDQRLDFAAGMTPRMARLAKPQTVRVAAPSIVWSAYSDPRSDGANGFNSLRRFFDAQPQRPLVGRYFSACWVREQPRFTPPETVPFDLVRDDRLPNAWPNEPGRRLIDLKKPDVRERMAKHFVEAAKADADFLVLDNVTVEYFTPVGQVAAEWDAAQYALLAEVRRLSRDAGVRFVPNVASRPEKTWAKLTPLVDGLLFEMPVHPNVQKSPEVLEAELAAYRAALDAHLFVGLVPEPKSVGLVAATAMLIREPGDALFVSHRDSVPTEADWMTWPGEWGAAQAPYARAGSVFSRDFEQVRLEIDFATGSITVTPR